MVNKAEYKFYIQQIIDDLGSVGDAISIEDTFEGCRYKSFEGLESWGKPKVYTEKYAESSVLDVYIPENESFENPILTLTLYFFGKDRRKSYHDFVNTIIGCKFYYWDTCRKRKVAMFLSDAIEPSKDQVYKNNEYIECSFKFTNLNGYSSDI